jgi:hypothetical protein
LEYDILDARDGKELRMKKIFVGAGVGEDL